MKKRLSSYSASIISSVLFALPALVSAKGVLDDSYSNLKKTNTGNALGGGDLPTLIGGLINVVIGSFGVFFVFYIIQAGIKYMTANGDSKKTEEAKKMIQTAVIGMIILVSAYAISSFVIAQISGAVATDTSSAP